MARNYGRYSTSIWRDPDFTSLTLAQQAVYFTLGLQPDVTAAGTLPYTARRWAKLSAGTVRDEIEDLIDSLAEHAGQHLVVDEDTEEVLIRKFIKWDGGWCNSKRLPVIVEAIRAIASDAIRDVALGELRALALSDMASAEQRQAAWYAVSAFDRVVVTEGESVAQPATPNPHSATHEREPLADAGEQHSPFCSKHPNGTEKPCGPCSTARLRFAAWQKGETARAVAARKLRESCTACGGDGWRDDNTKCDHRRTA